MGISTEIWATCDYCEYSKSYHPDYVDDPPQGFKWFEQNGNPTGKLLCWDCLDRLEYENGDL